MDFKDEIKLFGDKVEKLKNQIQTEEATKNAFIMPFIKVLGYDVFDPFEVMPEFIADIGIKKGEKVDYAILKEGKPSILIECKHWGESLDPHNSQLFRYFHTTTAKFGLLSNGIIYRFYTDLTEQNKMDDKPFFEFNVTDIKDNQIEELKKFHKSYFNLENIQTTASELKYMNELKTLINIEFQNPSEGLIKLFTKQIYRGMLTSKIVEQFGALTRKSIQQYINDLITDRLKSALKKENDTEPADAEKETATTNAEEKGALIETTEEEKEGYMIVKTILRQKIKAARIAYRDAQSYFAILLDDNNRKTICRLYFNGSRKYIGTFDEQKKETRTEMMTVDDIFKFEEILHKTVDWYDAEKSAGKLIQTLEQ
ncbi:type I restriction endonuclease [Chitinophaga sp. 22321]|uniref:Type I restriction enzyme HsdR N-terminal domain-containing protein n=1 Tax=Chitinophaga hostae TaxID=2831022 RepID=A0ABS5IWW0_9BACT|nr:type I restriction endonuclease [Chitinophaga hostae]MBS0027343.1 type I restriction enzyme HsdR N-terminal domain-containing protein [Chitinophaga hostae]